MAILNRLLFTWRYCSIYRLPLHLHARGGCGLGARLRDRGWSLRTWSVLLVCLNGCGLLRSHLLRSNGRSRGLLCGVDDGLLPVVHVAVVNQLVVPLILIIPHLRGCGRLWG